MLGAIKSLGEYEIEHENIRGINQFIKEAKLKNMKKVICIVFDKKDGTIKYNFTHSEDYDSSKYEKYLYEKDKGNNYFTPTVRIALVRDDNTKKVLVYETMKKALKYILLSLKVKENEDSLLSFLEKGIKDNKKKIHNDVEKIFIGLRVDKKAKINEQANSLLTIKIEEGGVEKYIGDIELFKKIFLEKAESQFSSRKSFGTSMGNGICCICNQNAEVLGFMSHILPFSTVDKRGFAPEFKREYSWKRLPICNGCARKLNVGKEFLDKFLLKKRFFHDYQFYVIPKFVLGEPDKDLVNEIKRGKGKDKYEGLLVEDDYILEPLLKRGDILSLIFMFIRPKQGGNFDIVRYIEDVPPSWIRNLDVALKNINGLLIFNEESLKKIGIVGKKKSGDLKHIDPIGTNIGGLVATFFPSSKETGIYGKYFIDVVGDILSQRAINVDFLIEAFIREIRNRYVNNKDWEGKLLSLKSLLMLSFLGKIKLLKNYKQQINYGNLLQVDLMGDSKVEKIETFFKEYGQAFDMASARAVFLEGVLSNFLLALQFMKRRSKPFQSKLYGLQLDVNKIKKLLPMIKEKLWEYDAEYYSWLEELISRYFVEADKSGWNLTKDEISYYFALGLNLGGIFKEKKDNNEEASN